MQLHPPRFSIASRWRLALAAFITATACLGLPAAGNAAQVSLDAPLTALLVPGSYAIVGTEQYSNFSFHASATNGGYLVQSSDITVAPYTPSNSSHTGIMFQTPALFVANGEGQDVLLSFDITELNPNSSITSMELMFDGATSGNGRASTSETVTNSSNSQLGQGLVVARQGLINGGNSTAMVTFVGQNTIRVSKDISLFSGAAGSVNNTAQVSDIMQLVDPIVAPVPEPSSVVMMSLGAGGLGWFGWRRKRKAMTVQTA